MYFRTLTSSSLHTMLSRPRPACLLPICLLACCWHDTYICLDTMLSEAWLHSMYYCKLTVLLYQHLLQQSLVQIGNMCMNSMWWTPKQQLWQACWRAVSGLPCFHTSHIAGAVRIYMYVYTCIRMLAVTFYATTCCSCDWLMLQILAQVVCMQQSAYAWLKSIFAHDYKQS